MADFSFLPDYFGADAAAQRAANAPTTGEAIGAGARAFLSRVGDIGAYMVSPPRAPNMGAALSNVVAGFTGSNGQPAATAVNTDPVATKQVKSQAFKLSDLPVMAQTAAPADAGPGANTQIPVHIALEMAKIGNTRRIVGAKDQLLGNVANLGFKALQNAKTKEESESAMKFLHSLASPQGFNGYSTIGGGYEP